METTNNSDNTEKKENQEEKDSQTNQTSSTPKREKTLSQRLREMPYTKATPEEKLQGFVRFVPKRKD
jgi:hypothetical protein